MHVYKQICKKNKTKQNYVHINTYCDLYLLFSYFYLLSHSEATADIYWKKKNVQIVVLTAAFPK